MQPTFSIGFLFLALILGYNPFILDVVTDFVPCANENETIVPADCTNVTIVENGTNVNVTNCIYYDTRCHSDCFRRRMEISKLVFLGKVESASIKPYCWLKRPFDLSDEMSSSSMFIRESLPCGPSKDKILSPPRYRFSIIFANISNLGTTSFDIALTAQWIRIDNSEAWQLAISSCGVSMGKAAGQISPYLCCPSKSNCSNEVSVADIEELNNKTSSNSATTVSTSTTTTPAKQDGQCDEDCIFEMCDSNCLMARIHEYTEVFWGESFSDNNGSNWVNVYCWFKTSANRFESKVLINGTVPPTFRCKKLFPSSQNKYLFFAVPNTAGTSDTQSYTLVAKPVLTSSYRAWHRVTSLCKLSELHGTSLPPPFGACLLQHPTSLPSCYQDVEVQTIEKLSGEACPGDDDSLAVRFAGVSMSRNSSLITCADVLLGGNHASLLKACTLNGIDKPDSFSVAVSSDTCFRLDDGAWKNNTKYIFGIEQISNGGEPLLSTKPIVVTTSGDAWRAVTRMCSLRNLNASPSNCKTRKSSGEGCFFDLSAKEIQQPDFSLGKKLNNCGAISSESFFERFNKSDFVVFGKVGKIAYPSRQFSIEARCILKDNSGKIRKGDNLQLSVSQETDGCFAIDDQALRTEKEFIFFFDSDKRLTMQEITISNRTHLSLFASVCGNLVSGGCNATVDPCHVGCYNDLNISSVVNNVPGILPPLVQKEPKCCAGMASEVTNVTYLAADQILWGKVDAIDTLTKPESNGDQIIGVSLDVQCYLKESENRDAHITVLTNLSSLVAPIHVGNDYIFVIRRIENNPCLPVKVSFEAITPPVLATKATWMKLCSLCYAKPTAFPYPTGSDQKSAMCGGQDGCYNQRHQLEGAKCDHQLNLNDTDVYCPVLSDDFSRRLNDSGSENAPAIWGKILSTEIKKMPRPSQEIGANLEVAIPLRMLQKSSKLEMQHVNMQPLCQFYGDDLFENSFNQYSIDCFYDPNMFELNERYIVFLSSRTQQIMLAPAILADERTITNVSQSCDIRPSPIPNSPDEYHDLCRKITDEASCVHKLSISEIAASRRQAAAPETWAKWWAILLIVISCLIVTFVLGCVIVRGVKRYKTLSKTGYSANMESMIWMTDSIGSSRQLVPGNPVGRPDTPADETDD